MLQVDRGATPDQWLAEWQGLVPIEGSSGETSTRGLDTLVSNCADFYRWPSERLRT